MLYALAVFATLIGLQRIAVSHWSAYRAAIADTASFLEERMAGMEDIRSSGAERHNLAQLTDLTNQQLRQRRLAELLSNVIFASTNFLFLIGYALGLGIGAFLYTSGQASIGGAFLIVVYIGMIAEPLETIRNEAQELQQAAASIGRIAQLFAERSRLREQPSASLPSGPLSVSFDHVSFAYRDSSPPPEQELAQSDDDRVLREITLSLAPGQILGLLGRTGSGKSTTARLVARLYDPDQGRICVGGSDLRTLALSELRTRVGVVTQDVQIFQASIRDNLRLFQTHIPDAALETALRQLGLLDWVRNLPEGLDTRLGPGGMGLSAGEAQLLAFARVFLNNPGLVIMDEASSRLDPATERLLEQAITRLLAGRTAIIIAHRLTTIQRADQILILEQGSVSEQGARAVLAADPQSRFAALLRVGMQEVLA
jgi:ABC-type multidrug transport system fused ATPase/permease subunit